jgi:subfamily B ATP-binding cassette protein MsbA
MNVGPARKLSAFGTWKRLLHWVRPHLALAAVAVFAATLSAAAAAMWAWLLGPLVEAVVKGGQVQLGPFSLSQEDLVLRLPLGVVAVSLVKACSSWLHSGLMTTVAQRALSAIRRQLYERLLALPPGWFEQRHSGELLSRFTSDVTQVEFALGQALSSWAKDSLQVLALFVACVAIDWRLALLTFVVLPGMIIPVSRFARSARKAAVKTQASLGALTMLAAEQLHNLPVVQAYRTEPWALERFDAEQGRYLQVMKKSLFVRGAFTPTTELVGIVGVGLAIVFGAQAVARDPTLASHLISFLTAALLMYQPTKAISGTLSQVAQGLGAAERLFEILDAQPDADGGEEAGPLSGVVKFDDVTVTWPDGRTGLSGASFEVPAGKTVALVGPSGAGKSTALSALLGFIAPSQGQVLWNGRALSALSRRSLRHQLGWVPQEPVLLSGSVRDNLRLGRADAPDYQLWRALTRAHAADFVRALPKGLDDEVGERGSRLSGGQRQRLAIARAFLREPSLLLLDEPTSALDAATEGEVQAGLKELMAGRTTLVVAHRLATVRKADLIIVIDGGKVVETGTHDRLTAAGGLYARLAEHGLQRDPAPGEQR